MDLLLPLLGVVTRRFCSLLGSRSTIFSFLFVRSIRQGRLVPSQQRASKNGLWHNHNFVTLNLQVLDFVADTPKIGLETQKHFLHPCENGITALNLRDRKRRVKRDKWKGQVLRTATTLIKHVGGQVRVSFDRTSADLVCRMSGAVHPRTMEKVSLKGGQRQK